MLLPIMEILFAPLSSEEVETMFKKTSPSLEAYIKLMANHAEHSKVVSNKLIKEYIVNHIAKKS